MAIATIERDPARDSGAPDLRFRLQAEICRMPGGSFWRAIDRRSGKSCVVRVIDDEREQSSRRLGDLHRERTLAERLGLAAVLRTEVPQVEAGRIFQLVDPEPARAITPESEGGRLAMLQVLVAVADVLAAAHARGLFHGAFSRDSCLRAVDGRVLVHGFMGDASTPAVVLDGAAADHRAFLEFADELLRTTGGPPPRLRRYFAQFLAEPAPRPAAHAMTELCAELRESLEDTFPWPLASAMPEAATAPAAAAAAVTSGAAKLASKAEKVADASAARLVVPTPAPAPSPVRAHAPVQGPAPGLTPAPAPSPMKVVDVGAQGPVARPADPARTKSAATAPSKVVALPLPQPVVEAASPAKLQRVPDAGREADDETAPRARAWRAWGAGLLALLLVGAALHWASKSRPGAERVTAPVPAAAAAVPASVTRAEVAGDLDAPNTPSATERDLPRSAMAESPSPAVPATPPASPPIAAVATSKPSKGAPAPSRPVTARPEPSRSALGSGATAAAAPPTPDSPQAVRSRVATLVAGGNRALNALEPGAATEAFAAALALSPADPAARDGSLRARRLEGVAALMRDAREATARGDHARAVQGYAQALSNDPRNRGLADALATARRNLGRDATGTLLADGHAALGAGRFEEARAAFERALAADPQAPGARQAAAQAATAIQLRDQAEARRAATLTVAGQD